MANDALRGEIEAEIVALHVAFEQWMRGTRAPFARIEASLDPELTFISPQGDVVPRDQLMAGLRQACGARPELTIRIEDVRVRHVAGDMIVATYEEWHRHPTYETARQSTAVLTRADAAPGGLRWLHVHETWLQPPPSRTVPRGAG